jgi:hypothetical protein
MSATEEVARYDWDTTRVQRLLRRVSSAMSDELDVMQARGLHRSDQRGGLDSLDPWLGRG